MDASKRQTPFGRLGEKLREFRETRHESLAEVSGAIEIETDMLERIERGEECPTEDILTLLISHFSLREQDAVQLWEWAGFARMNDSRVEMLQDIASKAAVVLVALDARAIYSDASSLVADKNGVTLSFMQSGPQGQQLPISRIGMSYEHAEQMIRTLQSAILRKKYLPEHKQLPPGNEQ